MVLHDEQLGRVSAREARVDTLSLAELCGQIKDPERNGGRSLDEVVEHMSGDALVGWAWEPGRGRVSAPGSWEAFGELIAAWAESGAACPQG